VFDAAASSADPINKNPGFKATLHRIAGNGVHYTIVESPDRFARDLTVQLTGHGFLRGGCGVMLVRIRTESIRTEAAYDEIGDAEVHEHPRMA
jgi:hypothetical protein